MCSTEKIHRKNVLPLHAKEFMKKIFAFLVGACLSMGALAQSALTFDANAGVKPSMAAYDGTCVNYRQIEVSKLTKREN